MLEGVAVVGYIIVVVVGIGEEAVAGGEDVGGGEVGCRQLCLARVGDGEYLLGVVVEVSSEFIS